MWGTTVRGDANDDGDHAAGQLVHDVRIPSAEMAGALALPADPRGLVVFALGNGSSRFDPGNREVSRTLNDRGLATLLVDLLRWEEERDRTNVFDIRLRCERLIAATRWAQQQPGLAELGVGYFGAGTGAAAVLCAAARLRRSIGAVVSVGGRPDLADGVLPDVVAPVLLIVGDQDGLALEFNREARLRVSGTCRMTVMPGVADPLEGSAPSDEVAGLAGDWFERHLLAPASGLAASDR